MATMRVPCQSSHSVECLSRRTAATADASSLALTREAAPAILPSLRQ